MVRLGNFLEQSGSAILSNKIFSVHVGEILEILVKQGGAFKCLKAYSAPRNWIVKQSHRLRAMFEIIYLRIVFSSKMMI